MDSDSDSFDEFDEADFEIIDLPGAKKEEKPANHDIKVDFLEMLNTKKMEFCQDMAEEFNQSPINFFVVYILKYFVILWVLGLASHVIVSLVTSVVTIAIFPIFYISSLKIGEAMEARRKKKTDEPEDFDF